MNKKLQQIWFNPHGFKDELYPYKLVYGLIYKSLLNKMYNSAFCSYEFIYVDIGIKELLPLPETSEFTTSIAVEFDFEQYNLSDENTKEQIVINLFHDALTSLALREKIDSAPIDEITCIVRQHGTDTLLNIRDISTDNYSLKIAMPAIGWIQPVPVYLSIIQRSSGREKTICIGNAVMIEASVWLFKITISSKTILIKSSASARFVKLLKDRPTKIKYNIEELLSGEINGC